MPEEPESGADREEGVEPQDSSGSRADTEPEAAPPETTADASAEDEPATTEDDAAKGRNTDTTVSDAGEEETVESGERDVEEADTDEADAEKTGADDDDGDDADDDEGDDGDTDGDSDDGDLENTEYAANEEADTDDEDPPAKHADTAETETDGLRKTDDSGTPAAESFEEVPLEDRPTLGPVAPRERDGDPDCGRGSRSAPGEDTDLDSAEEDSDPGGSSEESDPEGETVDAADDGADDEDAETQAVDDGGGDAGSEDEEDETDESDDTDETDDIDETDDDDIDETDDDDTATPEAKTDGHGHPDSSTDRQEPTYPNPDEDIGGISTPPDDEEMPLADHIEEMVMRLAVVVLFGSAATAIALLWSSQGITLIWDNVFPAGVEQPPHVYHPLELWLTRIKVAALAGIMVAIPLLVYQCYLFMRPGLYPHERKYYLAAVPTSVVLAGVGMLFSFVVVLPILFEYFTFYSEGSADIAYALGETFNLIITLTGFMAIVFQIPLFVILAVLMGVTTRTWLTEKRLYFWAAFFGLSFMFTIDPTLMAPIIVGIVMILLFEGTLLLLKWAGQE